MLSQKNVQKHRFRGIMAHYTRKKTAKIDVEHQHIGKQVPNPFFKYIRQKKCHFCFIWMYRPEYRRFKSLFSKTGKNGFSGKTRFSTPKNVYGFFNTRGCILRNRLFGAQNSGFENSFLSAVFCFEKHDVYRSSYDDYSRFIGVYTSYNAINGVFITIKWLYSSIYV